MMAPAVKKHPPPKPSHCSPARFPAVKANGGSCLSNDDVFAVALYISRSRSAFLGFSGIVDISSAALVSGDPTSIRAAVHKHLGTKPGEEETWLNHQAIVSNHALVERLQNAFRPTYPEAWNSNPRVWLNTIDLEQVLRQYEVSHPRFKFVGVFPRDFATKSAWSGQCISPPMCSLSVSQLRQEGRTQFGIVFNMDKHDQRGSHWTACYGGVDPRRANRFGIWYYDSVGYAAPGEIKAFMTTFAADVKTTMGAKAGAKFVVQRNKVRKQFQDTECGIYALFFVAVCLTTRTPFETICRKTMGYDAAIHKLRKVFFRPPPSSQGFGL